jgi:hypothetical protein
MTQPTKKPAFGSPKERGVHEEALKPFLPPAKDCPPLKRGPVETPNNDDNFSK